MSRVEVTRKVKALMFREIIELYLSDRKGDLSFRGSFPHVFRMILNLSLLFTFLIGSPLKDPKINSEILVIRKEY